LICISTDIGGYVFGKFFKGPKLTKVSPNKTYSGVLGGFLFTYLTIYIYSYFDIYFSFSLKIIFYSLILSAISQIGDLIISFFKRRSNIKDTGSIIPGHGGILDRIDGMIFVFPFAYITFDLIKI
jgi:phosphatidate cytidylyltransferase